MITVILKGQRDKVWYYSTTIGIVVLLLSLLAYSAWSLARIDICQVENSELRATHNQEVSNLHSVIQEKNDSISDLIDQLKRAKAFSNATDQVS